MAFKVIVPRVKGANKAIKGLSFHVSRKGMVTFSNDLVADMGADGRTYIAFFVNTDNNTLSFSVTNESNPVAKRFYPRKNGVCPSATNIAIVHAGAQLGRWNVTGKQDDIYLTDCPIKAEGGK